MTGHIKPVIWSILFLGLAASGAPAASSRFWEPLEAGRYSVGFRLLVETDNDRPALAPATGLGRQIPIAIWYPAKASSRGPMRFRDYVILSEQAVLGIMPEDAYAVVQSFVKPKLKQKMPKAELDRFLDLPVAAVRSGPSESGRFPLVLFAHASPETESVMCEYLASHGYIVAAVRSRAANDVTYKLSRENLDAMVADHAFAAARLQRDPNVSNGAIGVIGMSNGSIGAVALQLKGVHVGAIVSLDGGIGENAGGTYLKERSNGDASKLVAPILHFYAPNNPHLNLDQLRSYDASARTLVFVRGMRHADFLAYPVFDRIVPGFSGTDSSSDAFPGFVWVNRYTLAFLNANLRQDRVSTEWLEGNPESHGVAPGLFTVEQLKRSRPNISASEKN